MRKISKLSTLALVAALALPAGVSGTLAQAETASPAGSEACELGPDLSAEALRAIEDQSERLRMLSCMIGTPREYAAELAGRQPGSEIRAINVEEAWGQEVVAEGLQQSAEANAAVTGDLQAAIEADAELSAFIESEGYPVLGIIGYRINPDGSTDIFVAPLAAGGAAPSADAGAEGNPAGVQNEAMAKAMEEAVEEELEEGGEAEGEGQ